MITLLFSTSGDPISKLIRDYDHGMWSHVDCIDPVNGTLIGARSDEVGGKPSGVQARPPGYIKFDQAQRVEIPCSWVQQARFYKFVHDQIGKPYDTVDLLANFSLRLNWRNPGAWWCSELIGAAEEDSGVIHLLATPVNFLSPNALYLVNSALVDLPSVYLA